MRTIHKLPINITDQQTVMAAGRIEKVLSVGLDGFQQASIWVLVDLDETENFHRSLNVSIYGTGNPADNIELEYEEFIGTFITNSALVWHVFVQVV